MILYIFLKHSKNIKLLLGRWLLVHLCIGVEPNIVNFKIDNFHYFFSTLFSCFIPSFTKSETRLERDSPPFGFMPFETDSGSNIVYCLHGSLVGRPLFI